MVAHNGVVVADLVHDLDDGRPSASVPTAAPNAKTHNETGETNRSASLLSFADAPDAATEQMKNKKVLSLLFDGRVELRLFKKIVH